VTPRGRRPSRGSVVERRGKAGTSYAISYRFNGRRRYRTVGHAKDGHTRRDAERELQDVLADINRGRHAEPNEATFHEFASDWFHRREPELKPATVREYKDTIELHLSPYFGEYRLCEITIGLVDGYKAAKLRAGRHAPYTINKHLTRLSQILEDAVRYKLIPSNPAGHAKRLKTDRPNVGYLEPEQVLPLLDEVPDHYRPLFEVLIRAGLRIGEGVGLRWADVDFARSVLLLRRTVYKGQVQETTKSGEREGSVRMTPALARVLARWQLQQHDGGRGEPDDWVFPSDRDTPLSGNNMRNRVLRPAIGRANLKLAEAGLPAISEQLTLHDLRRSCCSLLFASGAALPEVMERMRHRDASTTLRVYARVMRSREKSVDAALDALIEQQIGNKSAEDGPESNGHQPSFGSTITIART
jgi:integrase